MLSELHNEYKNHPTKGTNLANAVIFGNMAKKHLLNDLRSFWDQVKLEVNAWRGAKWSDFKPRIPSRDNVIESAVFTALLVFTLPLKLVVGCMNGAGCGCNRGGRGKRCRDGGRVPSINPGWCLTEAWVRLPCLRLKEKS